MPSRDVLVVDVFGVHSDGSRTDESLYSVEGPRQVIFGEIDWQAEAASWDYPRLHLRIREPKPPLPLHPWDLPVSGRAWENDARDLEA